jgi:outer membrane protein OmpA-like peptidoglycan-associated protein
MMPGESRFPRILKTWLGLLSGGICLVAGAAQPAALPVGGRPLLPDSAILIQARPEALPDPAGGSGAPGEPIPGAGAAGSFGELYEALAAARARLEELSAAAEAVAATGELRQELERTKEENQQLVAEIEALRGGDQAGEQARRAAEARVAELSQALEEVTARARQIDQELIAVRWQNAQLNTSLAQNRAARAETEAQADQTHDALSAKVQALAADDERTAAELTRLRAQMAESERRLAAAASAQSGAERQLAEMRRRVQAADRAGERLATVEKELRAAQEQADSARQDLSRSVRQAAALQTERDDLRARLAGVSEQLERAEAANDRLESQVGELREAAGTATDAARQNLLVVEQRIKELNEALGAITPAAGASMPPPPAESRDVAATRSSGEAAPAAAAVADQQEAAGTGASNTAADLEVIKAAGAQDRFEAAGSPALLANLSLEQRLHVQGLLSDLNGRIDEEGLKMVVPGGILFAINSEEVQDSAAETLAKVAELIDVYDDRKVRIVGYTDALGDAAYNRMLSERRAALVKQFFVDNFDVEETRLSTEGLGEARPIASNATLEGRRANRRVEVVILN